MSLKSRLLKLERRRGEFVLIVVSNDETPEQALRRWCADRQK
jgi:hypothetical protein